jgi:hypothetical protein
MSNTIDKLASPVAESIAKQNGMPLDEKGHNPAIDYIIKQQTEANNSKQAKLPVLGK